MLKTGGIDGPFQSREDVIKWIDTCILGDLRTLRLGVDGYDAKPDQKEQGGRALGACNFLLVAGCCMALEYFGHIYIARGKHEEKVAAYIEKFLSPVNSRYSEVSWVMWPAFRHGIVHASFPKRLYENNSHKNEIVLGAGNDVDGLHLDADRRLTADSFIINGRQLLTDIEASFDHGFREWILKVAKDDALKRANPRSLPLEPGKPATAQLANIRKWRRP